MATADVELGATERAAELWLKNCAHGTSSVYCSLRHDAVRPDVHGRVCTIHDSANHTPSSSLALYDAPIHLNSLPTL